MLSELNYPQKLRSSQSRHLSLHGYTLRSHQTAAKNGISDQRNPYQSPNCARKKLDLDPKSQTLVFLWFMLFYLCGVVSFDILWCSPDCLVCEKQWDIHNFGSALASPGASQRRWVAPHVLTRDVLAAVKAGEIRCHYITACNDTEGLFHHDLEQRWFMRFKKVHSSHWISFTSERVRVRLFGPHQVCRSVFRSVEKLWINGGNKLWCV